MHMKRRKTFAERRRHPRYKALERARVSLSGDERGLPFHLMDIGEGGLSFLYLNETPMDLTGGRLDLYLEKDLHVGRLPVRVAADLALADNGVPKRRCCAEFTHLTAVQLNQLTAFIRRHM